MLLSSSWHSSAIMALLIIFNTFAIAESSSVFDISTWLEREHSDSSNHNNRWFQDAFTSDDRQQNDGPLQQSLPTKTVCNKVLASWTPNEVSANFFHSLGNSDVAPLLELVLQSKFVYGVQFRTVCASCRQVMARLDATTAASLKDICGVKAYGANATFSGLVMFPLTANAKRLATGTMKGVVYGHGTDTDKWPSTIFQGNQTTAEFLQFAALVSLGGSVVIIPDYMGFGSSLGRLYKAYTVLESYQTSFIPLWYQTQYVLAQSANCSAVLSDHAAIVGYSEGGYAAVAFAQALTKIGGRVIRVHSGGAPFRIASSAMLSIIQGIDNGTFPSKHRFVLAIIGSAYSGTFPLPNMNHATQYTLKTSVRKTIVELVTNSSSKNSLYAQVPIDDPLSIFNPKHVALARYVIAAGIKNPCNNKTQAFRKDYGYLCDSLLGNDLTSYLETGVKYPIDLCNSPTDALVSYTNLPNISRNSKYLSLMAGVTGSHEDAANYCVAQAFLYFIGPDFQDFAVANMTRPNGCKS